MAKNDNHTKLQSSTLSNLGHTHTYLHNIAIPSPIHMHLVPPIKIITSKNSANETDIKKWTCGAAASTRLFGRVGDASPREFFTSFKEGDKSIKPELSHVQSTTREITAKRGPGRRLKVAQSIGYPKFIL